MPFNSLEQAPPHALASRIQQIALVGIIHGSIALILGGLGRYND
jgi:hypothetical protein